MKHLDQPTREEIEKMYEDETGLRATQGQARIDRLEKFLIDNGLTLGQVYIFDDTDKIGKDYHAGIRWNAGTQHGDTILLGQTSGRGNFVFKNAIFAQSDEIGE